MASTKRAYHRKAKPILDKPTEQPESVETVAPAVSFTDTAEFRDAVAQAAFAAVEQILARTQPGNATSPSGDKSMMEQLAISIAQLTDQGVGAGNRRVDPSELAKRNDARKLMWDLIADVRKRKVKPQYRALNKLWLNERFIEPYKRQTDGSVTPVTFGWSGAPNEQMAPLDNEARAIFDAYKTSIGSVILGPVENKKPIWATPGGIIINGDAPQSMKVHTEQDGSPQQGRRFEDDLDVSVPAGSDPNAEFVPILGTVAPPARQNYAGKIAV